MFIDWSFWKYLDFIAFLCFMIIPIPMMIVTWLYVNKTPRKKRLIELGFGTNNAWYRGKWIGFLDASFLFGGMAFIAYAMILRKDILGKKIPDMDFFPNLAFNNHYNKLLIEFRWFSRWTLMEFFITLFGAIVLFIDSGIAKGWFNF